jgi:D-glycero-alpha-D-manno-heptose-7-phosphate kinase
MIISRTPFRLSLGGGGTDLTEYYSRYGSFFISAAINRFVYITVNPRSLDHQIWLSYSRIEQTCEVQAIEHDLIRECLLETGIPDGVEIHSITELSGGTGMGSSGAFCVGLLNALSAFRGKGTDPGTLAERAYEIEAERLGEPVGKQDQYIAAYGGLRQFEIDKEGTVTTRELQIPAEASIHLNSCLMLFYTGVQRKAYTVLAEESTEIKDDKSAAVESLHEIKDLGIATAAELEKGNIDSLGPMMHKHWQAKKRISARMSMSCIDECYDFGMSLGATGGKIIGAGGGGFLMFFASGHGTRQTLREELEKKGLKFMPFRFEAGGSQIVMQV